MTVLLAMAAGWHTSGCSPKEAAEAEPDYFGYDTAVLETAAGDIVIRVEKEKAPEAARNFLNLCGTGFYEGTFFHRVVPGLLVQGGDPNTLDDDPDNDGMGGYSFRGPGTFIPREENDLRHVKGSVSMVLGNGPDTAGSQFFILLDDVPEYDGRYTVFGRVENGLDILVEAVEQPGLPREEGGFRPHDPLVVTGCSVR